MSRYASDQKTLAAVADLPAMSRAELVQRWAEVLGGPAPPLKRELLMRVLAAKLQTQAFGDISVVTRGELSAATRRARNARRRSSDTGQPISSAPSLSPGTKLIKLWRGKTYAVDVLAKGFGWNGQHYPSLSAAAKAITGSHWNGMIFFGLRHRTSYGAAAVATRPDRDGAAHG